jgi:hypothetical protein
MKLPWYLKETKMTFEDGEIYEGLKVSELYILLTKIKLFLGIPIKEK